MKIKRLGKKGNRKFKQNILAPQLLSHYIINLFKVIILPLAATWVDRETVILVKKVR